MNIFEELWTPFRKYIIPGGMTDEEKERIKENWEKASEKVKENEANNGGTYNPIEPIVESTGISQNAIIAVAVLLFAFLAFRD